MSDSKTIAPMGLRLEWTEHGVALTGTPEDYRAAAANFSAAVQAAEPGKPLQIDFKGLLTDDSDPFEADVAVVQQLPPRTTPTPERGCAWAGWVIFAGIVLLVILAAVGAGAIFVYFKR